MQGLVKEETKSERLTALQSLLREQQSSFNENCIGKTMPVLFDGTGNRDGQLYGRTMYNQAIHVQAHSRLLGQIARVTVTAANAAALTGEMAVNEAVLAA